VATYLISGGGGFIGSNIAEELLRRGDDVRVLDDFSTGRRENLAHADAWAKQGGAEFRLIEGDIRDEATRNGAVAGAEFVIHTAAVPSVQRSVENPAHSNDVNVNGTLGMLIAARDHGVQRFVFSSSSSLYGESEVLPKVETMRADPISPYGLQKLAGETYCRLFHRLYGMPTVALRYFNVFGPRQDPGSEYSAVIPRFIAAVQSDRPPTVYGDGEQTRDFTFVANVVRANLLACEAGPAALGGAYNIGCGDRISLNDLLRALGELVGREVRADHAAPRAGDIKHSLADIGLAADRLGYEPAVELLEGLKRTVEAS